MGHSIKMNVIRMFCFLFSKMLLYFMHELVSFLPLYYHPPLGGCWPVLHQEGTGGQLRLRPEDGGEDLVSGG